MRCLTVGRLVPKKGHVDLLHAFGSARRHHPYMTLDIVGLLLTSATSSSRDGSCDPDTPHDQHIPAARSRTDTSKISHRRVNGYDRCSHLVGGQVHAVVLLR
jgi:glycosyltransferase involved in cell wall biosynthesis